MHVRDGFQIKSEAELDSLYADPLPTATRGTLDHLHDYHLVYLRRAPIVCIGSGSDAGFDVSPRGGDPGFVQVLDRRTLAIPDVVGNNKIETLRNVVRDGRIALLFLFPGLDIFLRIRGRALITRDPQLLTRLVHAGKTPVTVIVISTEAVYFHCGRAINRSRMWDPKTHISRADMPSPGTMMRDLCSIAEMTAEQLDALYSTAMHDALY